jgi:hypothetical protein
MAGLFVSWGRFQRIGQSALCQLQPQLRAAEKP